MSERARAVMQALYGGDIWEGYRSSGESARVIPGWNGLHPALIRVATEADPAVVIDVGVWKGQSTITLAKALRDGGRHDGCVVAVDTFLGSFEHWGGVGRTPTWEFSRRHGLPDVYDQFLSNVWNTGTADMIVPIPQTSATAALVLRRAKIVAGVVHIDAAHDYEDVVRDIAAYWPMIAPGGWLIGDDYPWAGVKRAVDEFSARVKLPLTTDGPKWLLRKPAG